MSDNKLFSVFMFPDGHDEWPIYIGLYSLEKGQVHKTFIRDKLKDSSKFLRILEKFDYESFDKIVFKFVECESGKNILKSIYYDDDDKDQVIVDASFFIKEEEEEDEEE